MSAAVRGILRLLPLLVLLAAAGCGGGPDLLEEELARIVGSSRYIPYVVKSGDTLWSVSQQFGTSVADLVALNRMSSTDELNVGQELRIPARTGSAAPAPVSEKGWMWPVRGKTVGKYGHLKDGLKSYGMDIQTGPGTPVVASLGGEVRKAGPFIGLGATVVIVHGDGETISMYGRIGTLLVKEGDIVKKGQRLGNAPELYDEDPIIHFRMFRKGYPVDPAKYLP